MTHLDIVLPLLDDGTAIAGESERQAVMVRLSVVGRRAFSTASISAGRDNGSRIAWNLERSMVNEFNGFQTRTSVLEPLAGRGKGRPGLGSSLYRLSPQAASEAVLDSAASA